MNENTTFIQTEQPVIPPTLAAPYIPTPKPKLEFLPHDTVFAWLAAILGILMMRYVVFVADGIPATLCFWLLNLLSTLYVRKCGCKPRLPHRIWGAVIWIFPISFSLTATPFLHGICFWFLLAAIIWRTHSICGNAGFVTRFFPLDLLDSIGKSPKQYMTAAPQAISSAANKSSAGSSIKTILLGLLVTIPLTIIVAVLLASADSGIEKMFLQFGNLLTENVMEFILQIGLGIPAGFYLFSVFYGAAQRKRKSQPFPTVEQHQEKLSALRTIPNLGLYAGITPICLLYLVYVISQMNYFFSAFAGRLPDGMIYSEYARRGFFELVAIAIINLIVVLVLTGCAKKGGAERPKILSVYAVILYVFTLFIIATALAKMFLYINAYGMTPLRVYATWFMILLAMTFLVLLLRQFISKLPTAAILTSISVAMLAILCFGKPEARIAEYNIRHYADGSLKDLDIAMLCGLSEDAYNVMARTKNQEIIYTANPEDWEMFNKEGSRIVESYRTDAPDKGWNLPAQLLIQQIGYQRYVPQTEIIT